uniref:complement factor H-like n=1 Tax=Euleptes europaea TaxID=460621 RepID=UPI002541D8C8|nr:complement factor H-like [Euleptes europaea]
MGRSFTLTSSSKTETSSSTSAHLLTLQENLTGTVHPHERPTCKSDPPANGYFTVRKDRFALNEITRYRCHIGFTTREGHEEGETRCLREGWTPKPECVQTCQKPTDGNVIISITKQVFVLEENLPYKCEDGYETITKALEDSSECTVNGWSPKPQCLPIQCEVLDLDNGEVKPRKDQYLYSDIVRFSCRPGHIRVGPLSAQCFHFGWSPPPPICKAAGKINSCQPPSNITDGIIITAVQEEYQHGQQVEYECNLKYAMTGSKKIECVDGQWTSLPSCTAERRTCGLPPRIDNGHALSRGRKKYFHGDTVRYECAEGFSVVGTNPAKCLHGHWDFPSCAEIPKNTNTDSLKRHYNNNEVVSYSCDSSQHITKCVKGNWSPKPDCRVKELCSPPPQPPNATKIIEVRNFENGEKIRFACQENFLLEGPQEILCEDGRWGKPPRCIDASCGNPPPIANGAAVNGTQGRYLPGSKVEYHCNEGFNISEIRFSTCKNRSWTTMPDCKDAACGDPPTITNADIISSQRAVYKPDHHVQYRCHEGFEMSGSDTVTCEIKVWSKPPTCEDVTCPPPTEIAHGEIVGQQKERYMPSERVHYQCDPGWNPSGPMVVTCFNKQWTKLPRCTDPNCGPPPGIQNGDFLNPAQASYPPGTTLRYQCQNLYVMNGSSEVRCENGHWTETPTCMEACTVSEEDMARNNIWLKWRSDPKLYSQSGDTMEFRCIWNHREAPLSPPFRTQCIQGNVEYPRCIPGY